MMGYWVSVDVQEESIQSIQKKSVENEVWENCVLYVFLSVMRGAAQTHLEPPGKYPS